MCWGVFCSSHTTEKNIRFNRLLLQSKISKTNSEKKRQSLCKKASFMFCQSQCKFTLNAQWDHSTCDCLRVPRQKLLNTCAVECYSSRHQICINKNVGRDVRYQNILWDLQIIGGWGEQDQHQVIVPRMMSHISVAEGIFYIWLTWKLVRELGM